MSNDELSADLVLPDAALALPRLEQYFGVWAVEEARFRGVVDTVRTIDLTAHIRAQQAAASSRSRDYLVTADGVAVLDVTGTITKYGSSLGGGASAIEGRRQTRLAARDSEVKAIALRIDSPGGSVAGIDDWATEIAGAARHKPVMAYIEDLGASAAYWLASQASAIYANPSALVGSIGVFSVIEDLSGLAAAKGIKVHVVRSGAFKGVGTPGTEVTHEQLTEVQRRVDDIAEMFHAAVARGRKLTASQVSDLADGRVHMAAAAKELGLIDGVQSWDKTLAQLAKSKPLPSRSANMSSETNATADQPATFEQLVALCESAEESAFIVGQMAVKATLPAATKAWVAENKKRAEAEKARADEAERKAAEPQKPKTGAQPVNFGAGDVENAEAGDAQADWREAVAAKVKQGMPRARAVAAVNREQPDLRLRFVESYNAEHRRRAG